MVYRIRSSAAQTSQYINQPFHPQIIVGLNANKSIGPMRASSSPAPLATAERMDTPSAT